MANNSSPSTSGQTGWSVVALPKGPVSATVANPADLASQDSMMIALNTLSPTTYDYGRLLNMTANDMVYALRMINDGSNI